MAPLGRFLQFLLSLTAMIVATPTHAQILTSGLNQIAGQYANSTTTVGAVANRSTANQLYQQSLADEKAAWSSFPPNVGLLSKALKEAQDGVKADDQSHSMAQEALHSNETGTNSGRFDLADYNAMGVDDIKKMANSSSPLWPQVASKLQGYGLSLTEDKQYMKTPFGTFPTNASPDQMASVLKQMAQKFGLSGDAVDKGIAAAQSTADTISKKAFNDAQQRANMKTAGQAKGSNTAASAADDSGNTGAKNQGQGRQTASEIAAPGSSASGDIDWDARARAVNAFRDKLQNEMGVEPIWNKEDDIFKKVHEHYVMLDKQNVFLNTNTIAAHP